VSIDKHAILLRGASGSGKSDLALRLIENGAILVSDDRCNLNVTNGSLVASPPPETAGLLEVRGVGIFRFDYVESAVVALVIDLDEPEAIERMPESSQCMDWGVGVYLLRLTAFEASAAGKVRIALQHAVGAVESIS